MIDNVYDYLIGKTSSIITSVSETFSTDSDTLVAVYRVLSGSTSKTLGRTRQYTTYPVNVLVRGNQDSKEIVDLCDAMVLELDMDQDGVIICLVTSEPQYAFTDDNGNLNYTFNLDVKV